MTDDLPLSEDVKAQLRTEAKQFDVGEVPFLINALRPEVRAEIVRSLFVTHIELGHQRRNLPVLLADALGAVATGTLVIDGFGITQWLTCHNNKHPKASMLGELLDVITAQVEGGLQGMATRFGMVKLGDSSRPPS